MNDLKARGGGGRGVKGGREGGSSYVGILLWAHSLSPRFLFPSVLNKKDLTWLENFIHILSIDVLDLRWSIVCFVQTENPHQLVQKTEQEQNNMARNIARSVAKVKDEDMRWLNSLSDQISSKCLV